MRPSIRRDDRRRAERRIPSEAITRCRLCGTPYLRRPGEPVGAGLCPSCKWSPGRAFADGLRARGRTKLH